MDYSSKVSESSELLLPFQGSLLHLHQQLRDYVGIGLLKGRKKALICIPATSGTGSEASPNAILVDDEDGQKKGIISPFLVPDVVILDPLLTISVPPSITAATGIDALTHCLEAYTNKFSQPFITKIKDQSVKSSLNHSHHLCALCG